MSKQSNGRRHTLDPDLQPKMQEQKFLGLLKARLISIGYTIAVPEPDVGEDIWIGTRVNKSGDRTPRTIYRAQVKSLYSYGGCTTIDKRTFDANDYIATYDYSLSQPCFAYIIGIRDERLEKETGEQFHIGCLPTRGFLRKLREKYPDAGKNGDRYYLQFHVARPDDKTMKYEFSVNIRRAETFCITPYFEDLKLGLRVSGGEQEVPSCLMPMCTRHSRSRHRNLSTSES